MPSLEAVQARTILREKERERGTPDWKKMHLAFLGQGFPKRSLYNSLPTPEATAGEVS